MKIIETSGAAMGHYSPAVLSRGTLYISGQVPYDSAIGGYPDGIEAQTRTCLARLDEILAAAGMERSDVVMCRIFVADREFWGPVNSIYAEFFGSHKPARLLIPTNGMSSKLLIEIEAIAEQKDAQ